MKLAGGLSLEQMRAQEDRFVSRHARASNNAKTADYWEKVFATRPKQNASPRLRSFAQAMDFEQARQGFRAILAERAAQLSHIEHRPFQWRFTEEERNALTNALRWLINDPSVHEQLPLNKGLYFYGTPGTGKTEMVKCLSRFSKEMKLDKAFDFDCMSGIYKTVRSAKSDEAATRACSNDRCFDELGRLTGPVMLYGDPVDIVEHIIETRYNRNRTYGQITHFVSNARQTDLKNLLSDPLLDRIRSMTTDIAFIGQSKR